MEPSPVDVLGGFHYFVVRLLEIVSEPGVGGVFGNLFWAWLEVFIGCGGTRGQGTRAPCLVAANKK